MHIVMTWIVLGIIVIVCCREHLVKFYNVIKMSNREIKEILIENIKVVSCGKQICVHKIGNDGLYLAPRVWNSDKMDYDYPTQHYIYGGSKRECEEYPIFSRPGHYLRHTDYSSGYYVWKLYGEYFDEEIQKRKKCVFIIEDKLNIELDKYIIENGINKLAYKYVKKYDDYKIGYVHDDEKQSIAEAFHITVDDVDKLIENNEFVCLQSKYGESRSNSLKTLAEKALAYQYREIKHKKMFWELLECQKQKSLYILCNIVTSMYIILLAIFFANKVYNWKDIVFTRFYEINVFLIPIIIGMILWTSLKRKKIKRIKNIKW